MLTSQTPFELITQVTVLPRYSTVPRPQPSEQLSLLPGMSPSKIYNPAPGQLSHSQLSLASATYAHTRNSTPLIKRKSSTSISPASM